MTDINKPLVTLSVILHTIQSLRKNMVQHLQQHTVHHAVIQAEFISKLKEESEKTSYIAQNLIKSFGSLERRFSLAERQLASHEPQFELQRDTEQSKPEYSCESSIIEQKVEPLSQDSASMLEVNPQYN